MTIAVLPGLVRGLVDGKLPDSLDCRYYTSLEEMMAFAPEAEIGWFDNNDPAPMIAAVEAAERLRWLNSIYAGLDFLPLDILARRGVAITHGAGINAGAIAEYVLLGILSIAKGYREVVRAQERRDWLADSPGKRELDGTRALLLGYGAIGQRVEQLLNAFGVTVTPVRRSGGENALGPGEWRDRLGEFDWVILALPATPETDGMIGGAELAAMKPDAVLVNVARGSVVDQPALVDALQRKTISAALLDVTDPEPLPPDHPLWSLDNAHVTMHLSGRSQTSMFRRGAERFVANAHRYCAGEPLAPRFDPVRGY